MDHRDRLILALSALVRAEREAREAWDAALAADTISRETLSALEGDPLAVLSDDDIELAEAFAAPAGSKDRAINA